MKPNEDFPKIKVAVVQAASVLFDREANVEKACRLTHEAAAQGAKLVLFPEAFIPAYPRGLSFGAVVGSRSAEGRRTWQTYWANSVDIPSPATAALAEAAQQANLYLAVGIIERDSQFSGGTLYCTMLYFSPEGILIGKHRKLKPTASERLIWGEGDGSTLTVLDTEIGKIGGLICWENYMPLARMEKEYLFSNNELKRLTMPILVIGGSKDELFPIEKIIPRMKKFVQQLKSELIPGMGHALVNLSGQILPFLV